MQIQSSLLLFLKTHLLNLLIVSTSVDNKWIEGKYHIMVFFGGQNFRGRQKFCWFALKILWSSDLVNLSAREKRVGSCN